MSEFQGSFLGFTFDDVHSSELNIVRVSNSNRYTESLAPDIQDITTNVPNGDGMYYFGTTHSKKTFTIQFAFDSVTEKQLIRMKQLFNGKGVHRLIFDEVPYKYYLVSISTAPNLQYVPFNVPLINVEQQVLNSTDLYGGVDNQFYEGAYRTQTTGRIYKGEGTIQFTAFTPYAFSTEKYRDNLYTAYIYNEQTYDNYMSVADVDDLDEWFYSRDWVSSAYSRNGLVIDHPAASGCLVYNPGDLDTPFKYRFYTAGSITTTMTLGDKSLTITGLTLTGLDAGIQVNTKLHLIEGIDSQGNITGTVYNQYITAGDFFDIPVMTVPEILETTATGASSFEIEYNYLYY